MRLIIILHWTYTNIPDMTILDRGYTGHEHLTLFGLINMNGRMYDPLIGQMLSPDPYVQDFAGSQGFNRYSYCLNNPLKYTDPSGENPLLIAAIVGVAISGFSYAASVDMAPGSFSSNWNTGNFFLSMGIGTIAGVASAGIANGIGSVMMGGPFGSGFMGKCVVDASFGFIQGFAMGASAGFTSGLISGAGNALLTGSKTPLKDIGVGATIGALVGGLTSGLQYGFSTEGRFWDGAMVEYKEIGTMPDGNLPPIQQGNEADCAFTLAASIDQHFGGNLTPDQIKYLYIKSGGVYDEVYGVEDAPFWTWFANGTNHSLDWGRYDTNEIIETFGHYRAALTISGHKNHAVGLNSTVVKSVTKLNGKINTKDFYKIMNPTYGSHHLISPRKVINYFILR